MRTMSSGIFSTRRTLGGASAVTRERGNNRLPAHTRAQLSDCECPHILPYAAAFAKHRLATSLCRFTDLCGARQTES